MGKYKDYDDRVHRDSTETPWLWVSDKALAECCKEGDRLRQFNMYWRPDFNQNFEKVVEQGGDLFRTKKGRYKFRFLGYSEYCVHSVPSAYVALVLLRDNSPF